MWALLRATKQEVDAGWVLWERKLFSFHDLSAIPWSSVCEAGTIESFSTDEWSESSDSDRQRVFVHLLNQTLKAQLSPDIRYWPQEDCYAMAGGPLKLSYQSLKRSSKITVVSRFSTTVADGREFEWFRHMAFRGQFRFLEGQWYLELTPTYRFTRDGHALERFHEDRLKGIKRIEGNRAVFSSVLFWADYLRPKTTLFSVSSSALRFGELLTFRLGVGIVDRSWLAADPDFARDAELNSKQLFIPDLDDGADS